jgi:putative transposase
VTNRGNDRREVFHEPADYQRFLTMLGTARAKHPIDVIGYCVMPNHFHLVLFPRTDTALSAYMQQVTGRYSCNYRLRTRTAGYGHVFQAPFWSHPVESMEHFLATLRYVEANPVRAGLVARAQDWPWSSLRERLGGRSPQLLSPLPVALPTYWCELVNLPQNAQVLQRLREELTRPPGRPRKPS